MVCVCLGDVYCMLLFARCALFVVGGLLFDVAVRCLLFVVCCLLFDGKFACCLLFVRCLWFVACFLLVVGCWLLFVLLCCV